MGGGGGGGGGGGDYINATATRRVQYDFLQKWKLFCLCPSEPIAIVGAGRMLEHDPKFINTYSYYT